MNHQQLGQPQVIMQQVQHATMAAQVQQHGIVQHGPPDQQHLQHMQHQHLQQPQQHHLHMPQQQQPPPPPPQPQQQPEQKQDNISRVKNLYNQLNESLMETLRSAGINISNNAHIDQGTKNAGEVTNVKFEEHLEKFYSVCDQMELHLKTAIDHSLQNSASQRYTPNPINATSGDNQKYAHYTSTIKNQVNYVKEIHGELFSAASNVSNMSSTTRAPSDHIASMDTNS